MNFTLFVVHPNVLLNIIILIYIERRCGKNDIDLIEIQCNAISAVELKCRWLSTKYTYFLSFFLFLRTETQHPTVFNEFPNLRYILTSSAWHLPTVPEQPPILKATNFQKDSITLVWAPPHETNGFLTGYLLQYQTCMTLTDLSHVTSSVSVHFMSSVFYYTISWSIFFKLGSITLFMFL